MEEIIRTKELSKDFGKVNAVKNLSINVNKGEIYGFLGLNGAGKTTTIRMLLGMINPTMGDSFINGEKVIPGNYKIWEKVGYMVEVPYSYPELTVRENLEIIKKLRFIGDKGAVGSIIEKLHLQEYAERRAKHLSQGNKQRLGLAKALIHHPEILLLDEPTNGLDPAGIVEIRELLQDMVENHGTTVFISSHILTEISRIASRIGIIHEGVLMQEINSDELDRLRQKKLMLKTTDDKTAIVILSKNQFNVTLGEDGVLEIKESEAILHPEKIAELLVNHGTPPLLLKVEEEDLETYFLRAIGKKGAQT